MRIYFLTFSKREILSALFSSTMLVSFYFFFKQFKIYDDYFILPFLTLSTPIILSHRFYLLEHKRRNRFLGRVVHDLIISIITLLLLLFALKITGTFHKVGFYSNLISVVLVSIYVVEIFLSFLNRVFIFTGWRIW